MSSPPRIVPGRGLYAGQAFVLHGCLSDGPMSYAAAQLWIDDLRRNPPTQESYDDLERRGLDGMATHFLTAEEIAETVPPSHDRAPALNGSRNRAALTAKRDAEGDGRLDSPPAPSATSPNSGAHHRREGVESFHLSAPPSPLMVAIDRRLARWRRRELNDDGVLWHGINRIRQGLTDDKLEAREALEALALSGRVVRWQCSSGVFWRGGVRDVIDVREPDRRGYSYR